MTYMIVLIFNGFLVKYFFNVVVFTIINFIAIGLFLSVTINITNYNFANTPLKYTNSLGAFNQLMTNAGHSLGVTLAVVVNSYAMPSDFTGVLTEDSVFVVYIFAATLAAIGMISSFIMGVFSKERGKWGYREDSVQRTRTFDENLIADPEMVSTEEEFVQTSKVDALLSLFNGG